MGIAGELLRELVVEALDTVRFFLLILLPSWLLTYVILTVCAGWSAQLLRRRGRLPSAKALGFTLGGVFFVLILAIFIAVPNGLIGQIPYVLDGLMLFAGSAALTGLSLVIVAAIMPPRRRTGPKQRVNSLASRVVAGFGFLVAASSVPVLLAIVVFAFRSYSSFINLLEGFGAAIAVAFLLVMAGGLLLRGANRLLPPGDWLPPDARTVFFVRPFSGELLPFSLAGLADKTLEEFLGNAVESRLGVLVALGNPTDRVAPRGAMRTYHSDVEWQDAVEQLTETCSCILASSVSSQSTTWELVHIRTSGHQKKLFILTPPKRPDHRTTWDIHGGWKGAVTVRLFSFTVLLYRGQYRQLTGAAVQGNLPPLPSLPAWKDMAATLADAGYQPGTDPGPGAVLTFDDAGVAIILEQDASEPDQYVSAIERRLTAIAPS
jgi:hypothetical protein